MCRFYVSTISIIFSTLIEAQPPVITRARVYTAEPLDREEIDTYQFSLIAQDNSEVPLMASIPLTVFVSDRNDNEPTFTSSNFNFVASEDTNDTLVSEFMVGVCMQVLNISLKFECRYSCPHAWH